MEFDGRIWQRCGDGNQTGLVLISTCLKAVPVPLWPRSDGWVLGSLRPIFLPTGGSAAERTVPPPFFSPSDCVIPPSISSGGPSEGLPTAWLPAQPAQHLDTDGASTTPHTKKCRTHVPTDVPRILRSCGRCISERALNS